MRGKSRGRWKRGKSRQPENSHSPVGGIEFNKTNKRRDTELKDAGSCSVGKMVEFLERSQRFESCYGFRETE